MLILPIGLADAPAARFPWASLAIALVCIGVFAAEPSAEPDADARRDAANGLMDYWAEHPYLVPSRDMARHLKAKDVQSARDEYERRATAGRLPDANTLAEEQDVLTRYFRDYLDASNDFSRRWGLVPSRGLLQPGWITSIFLHADIFHLGGNLLFFAVVGPTIESLFGVGAFLLYFLVAGIIAGVTQYALSRGSSISIIGASGAIAALMGLFTVRYASNRVKIFLFPVFRLMRLFGLRTVMRVPAIICGGLWITDQLFALMSGGDSGVAVGAHVGGFGLGVGTALVLAKTSFHKRLTKPIHDREQLWRKDSELEQAELFLKRGAMVDAERAFNAVLERRPTSAAASWGLAQIRFGRGDYSEGTRLMDRALSQWLTERNEEAVHDAVLLVGKHIQPELLRPSMVSRVAQELESVNRDYAIRAYEVAAKSGAERAKRRLTELRGPSMELSDGGASWRAPEAPPAVTVLPPVQQTPVPAIEHRARGRSSLVCSLASASAEALAVQTLGGKVLSVSYAEIAAIHIGLIGEVETLDETRRNVLMTELRLHTPREDVSALRLPLYLLQLPAFYPGTAPREAYYALISYIAGQSGAAVRPTLETIVSGAFPQFATVTEFEQDWPEPRALMAG